MAEEEWKGLLLKGEINAFNRWRVDHPDVEINLEGSDLKGLKLNGVYFMRAKLKKSNLSGSSLVGALFGYADLSEADLSNTDLQNAQFGPPEFIEAYFAMSGLGSALMGGAIMHKTKFIGADVYKANFRESDLEEADFTNAKNCTTANFKNAQMEGAIIPKPWYIQYLEAQDREELKKRAASLFQGPPITEEEYNFSKEYMLTLKDVKGADVPLKKNEISDIVQSLIQPTLSQENKYNHLVQLHKFLISSQADENIMEFLQSNGHAVVGLMSFDNDVKVRAVANVILTTLPSHHSTAARSFALRMLMTLGVLELPTL